MSFLKCKLSKVEFGQKVLPDVTVIPKWGMIQLWVCVCVCEVCIYQKRCMLKKAGKHSFPVRDCIILWPYRYFLEGPVDALHCVGASCLLCPSWTKFSWGSGWPTSRLCRVPNEGDI